MSKMKLDFEQRERVNDLIDWVVEDFEGAAEMIVWQKERIRELEAVLSAIIEYNDKGWGEEYIRAIDDAKELLEGKA